MELEPPRAEPKTGVQNDGGGGGIIVGVGCNGGWGVRIVSAGV